MTDDRYWERILLESIWGREVDICYCVTNEVPPTCAKMIPSSNICCNDDTIQHGPKNISYICQWLPSSIIDSTFRVINLFSDIGNSKHSDMRYLMHASWDDAVWKRWCLIWISTSYVCRSSRRCLENRSESFLPADMSSCFVWSLLTMINTHLVTQGFFPVSNNDTEILFNWPLITHCHHPPSHSVSIQY